MVFLILILLFVAAWIIYRMLPITAMTALCTVALVAWVTIVKGQILDEASARTCAVIIVLAFAVDVCLKACLSASHTQTLRPTRC